MKLGNTRPQMAPFKSARVINEAMVARLPEKPRYRSDLASNLGWPGPGDRCPGSPGVDRNLPGSRRNIWQRGGVPRQHRLPDPPSRCLRNQGDVLSNAGHNELADPNYQKALAVLDATAPQLHTADWQRKQAGILTNLGTLHGARPRMPCDGQSPFPESTGGGAGSSGRDTCSYLRTTSRASWSSGRHSRKPASPPNPSPTSRNSSADNRSPDSKPPGYCPRRAEKVPRQEWQSGRGRGNLL